jgi:Uma2 family endonuclease
METGVDFRRPTAADVIDIIDRLGGIDPARILLQPLPGTATERDLLDAIDGDYKCLCELVEGTLVVRLAGMQIALATSSLIYRLGSYADQEGAGVVLGVGAPYRLAPGLVRTPSVSFVGMQKWRGWSRHKPDIADFGPDFAAEVPAAGMKGTELARKRREYFASGTRLYWEVNPCRRSVTVFSSPTVSTRLTASDTLTGDPVLPGFRLPLAELFADPLGD